METKYFTFIDNMGRNVMGINVGETDNEVTVQNPVMITVQPQGGQFQVQLIPLFLAEFIAFNEVTKRNFKYIYSKSNIAVGDDFKIDPRITMQYEKIVEATNVVKQQTQAPDNATQSPEVIKLFED
jgi:hypothetical protein